MDQPSTIRRSSRYSLILFSLVVAQLCVVSISIAAASLLFGLTLLTVVLWTGHERRWMFPVTSLDNFFLAYMAIEFLTTVTAVNTAGALHNSKRLLLIVLVYIVVVSFDSRKRLLDGISIIAGAVAVLSLAEIVYYIDKHSTRLYVFQIYMTTGGLKMIAGLLLVPFTLHPQVPKKNRWWFLACLVPTFIALVLTNTRSSWLGFIGGIALLGILRHRYLFGALALFILLFFLAAPRNQVERAKSIVDLSHPSNYGRLNMWSTGMRIFEDHPLLGVGDSDLASMYAKYKSPDDRETGGHLHNNFVMILVTLGIFGFLIVMAMFAKILWLEYSTFHQFRDDWLIGSLGLGAVAVFTGFLVNGVFEWNFGDHEIMTFIWSTVGLTLAARHVGKGEGM